MSLSVFISSCRQAAVEAPPEPEIRRVTLSSGDTLSGSLNDSGLPPRDCTDLVRNLRKVFNPRSCRPGDYYEITVDTSNAWTGFRYYPPGLNYFAVERSTSGIVVGKRTRSGNLVTTAYSGRVQSSLWEAMSAQKIGAKFINDFADKFAWQIDFLTETRPGDTFKVVMEQFITDDGVTIDGRILVAQYILEGQMHTALLFVHSNGQEAYYTPDGSSLRRAFLKAPLQFARISSHFTKRRFHPVLKYYRPHLGIDYAAPSGTPVSSVADGTVIFAGWKGGFGRYLQVRHTNGYVTCYGHLKSFARGIRHGARVRQGQVIAYVGSTGLSTGPHLDFRIAHNGRYINYLSLKIPATVSIPAVEKTRFLAVKKELLTKLADVQ